MTSGYTPNFGWSRIGIGDSVFDDGGKFGTVDRDSMDALVFLALTGHIHDGAAGETNEAPELPLVGEVITTGGSIPAGTTLFYVYTLVDQVTGIETMASPEASLTTPDPVTAPLAPSLSRSSVGGLLIPGTYSYVLTAYTTGGNASETEARHSVGVVIPPGTNTNTITLTLPALPAGAIGFNVYRKKPAGKGFEYITSIDMTVATPPTTWTDDGSIEPDCDRLAPSRNTTNSTNSVELTFPGATPVVPEGFTWRLYRTVTSGDYTASFIHHVVEETSEGSGIITPVFVDIGYANTAGQPPVTSFARANPSKIDLTDMANVEGQLPAGAVAAFPWEKTFFFPGGVSALPGEGVWPVPGNVAQLEITGARISLGRGSQPVSQAVIVDVEVGSGTDPTFTSVYAADGDKPRVLVGDTAGVPAAATVAQAARTLDNTGVISPSVEQAGGGATPLDEDLTVVVYGWVRVADLTSHVWA